MIDYPQDQMSDSNTAIQGNFICPQTRQTLREATDGELAALRKIPTHTALEAAWISTDSSVAYPIKNGIPLLIPSAAIAIPKFPSSTP
jgi:uncharacterized protein YbaR (Trm112 family)